MFPGGLGGWQHSAGGLPGPSPTSVRLPPASAEVPWGCSWLHPGCAAQGRRQERWSLRIEFLLTEQEAGANHSLPAASQETSLVARSFLFPHQFQDPALPVSRREGFLFLGQRLPQRPPPSSRLFLCCFLQVCFSLVPADVAVHLLMCRGAHQMYSRVAACWGWGRRKSSQL